jgi:hypothetical protein
MQNANYIDMMKCKMPIFKVVFNSIKYAAFIAFIRPLKALLVFFPLKTKIQNEE